MTGRVSLAELATRLRRDGVRGVGRRLAFELYRRTGAEQLESAIDEADLADPLDALNLPGPSEHGRAGGPIEVGWICTAPGPGSGGHTTLFRMIAGAEARGMASTVYLHDARGGDLRRHERVIRTHWPWLRAEIRDAAESPAFAGMDAVVASSWETAHVLATRGTSPMARLYFVQDFEPLFHPHGSVRALAEDTYRFGFRTIALGEMVQAELAAIGVPSVLAPFGRDGDAYRLLSGGPPRSGLVFYAKRGNDRRGYLLGKLALHAFHGMHPEQEIHIVGDRVSDWDIPLTQHGVLAPEQLNGLYNRVLGGPALSFTNITLVVDEMLASGAIPVVNDTVHSRAVLRHPDAVWAPSSPGRIALALAELVEHGDRVERATRAAEFSARNGVGWDLAEDVVASAIRDAIDGARSPSAEAGTERRA
ncbi:glycosyltransferase family 1 protein [Agromyces allii]|uniref:Glycosyltransferase family 1 protein n=1 Tax=Agromyces allii TaxID=393607 RepID=A0ABP5C4G8_9MICO|nr:glycosyltransferase family 1 protein [Agromyces allii]